MPRVLQIQGCRGGALIRDEFCNTQLAYAETSGERFFLPGLIANQRGRHAETVAWYPTMRLFRQPHGGRLGAGRGAGGEGIKIRNQAEA
jgi:hypothetical protein